MDFNESCGKSKGGGKVLSNARGYKYFFECTFPPFSIIYHINNITVTQDTNQGVSSLLKLRVGV